MSVEPNIITSYVRPGIPITGYDWCALYADCEDHYAGWGGTKEAAISDLRCRYAHLWGKVVHTTKEDL